MSETLHQCSAKAHQVIWFEKHHISPFWLSNMLFSKMIIFMQATTSKGKIRRNNASYPSPISCIIRMVIFNTKCNLHFSQHWGKRVLSAEKFHYFISRSSVSFRSSWPRHCCCLEPGECIHPGRTTGRGTRAKVLRNGNYSWAFNASEKRSAKISTQGKLIESEIWTQMIKYSSILHSSMLTCIYFSLPRTTVWKRQPRQLVHTFPPVCSDTFQAQISQVGNVILKIISP